MSYDRSPYYNVCVARVYQGDPARKLKTRRVFTQVGVGWRGENDSVRVKIDLTIILGPDDELYLFPKTKVIEQTVVSHPSVEVNE